MIDIALPHALFLAMVAGYSLAAAGLVSPSPRLARWVTATGSTAGALAGLALAGNVLVTGVTFAARAPGVLAPAGGLLIELDRLGALFLGVIALLSYWLPDFTGVTSFSVVGGTSLLILVGVALVVGLAAGMRLAWRGFLEWKSLKQRVRD